MIEIERVCENCKYWNRAVIPGYAYCDIKAVNPDVGCDAEAIVALPGNATCVVYDDAFEPSDAYLDYLHEVEKRQAVYYDC